MMRYGCYSKCSWDWRRGESGIRLGASEFLEVTEAQSVQDDKPERGVHTSFSRLIDVG
jgi:hypothetical protein